MTTLAVEDFNQGLLQFLQRSPSPFHAVETMVALLEEQGFVRLDEGQSWQVQAGGKYYCVRNASSLAAFVLGPSPLAESGIKMMGAHTDSPCLKVKPQPELLNGNCYQLGVEVYGGALLNPWFDRDLSIAGRVTCRTPEGELRSVLIDFQRPVAVIPSLAIHLDREANSNRSINAQTDIPPLLMLCDQKHSWRELLLQQLREQHGEVAEAVIDYDLSLYDSQPPAVLGLQDDFIASARLDNLLSCYTGLQALLGAAGQGSCLLVCNDHEEVGSATASGAQGPMLRSVLERLAGSGEAFSRAMHHSMLISTDNAHAQHPNFTAKHDGNHAPLLNKGPVIKINANQRYASDSETSAIFRNICLTHDIPVQDFVSRSDLACGSTIGPITAAELGVKTLDVGIPTYAMHSIRELAGVQDAFSLYQVLKIYCD